MPMPSGTTGRCFISSPGPPISRTMSGPCCRRSSLLALCSWQPFQKMAPPLAAAWLWCGTALRGSRNPWGQHCVCSIMGGCAIAHQAARSNTFCPVGSNGLPHRLHRSLSGCCGDPDDLPDARTAPRLVGGPARCRPVRLQRSAGRKLEPRVLSRTRGGYGVSRCSVGAVAPGRGRGPDQPPRSDPAAGSPPVGTDHPAGWHRRTDRLGQGPSAAHPGGLGAAAQLGGGVHGADCCGGG